MITLAWLIGRLQSLAEEHGGDVPVCIHDADTDWPLALNPEFAVRFGKNEYGDGRENTVMIQSGGYHYEEEARA